MSGAEIRGLRNKVNAILYYALGEVWNGRGGIEAVENWNCIKQEKWGCMATIFVAVQVNISSSIQFNIT